MQSRSREPPRFNNRKGEKGPPSNARQGGYAIRRYPVGNRQIENIARYTDRRGGVCFGDFIQRKDMVGMLGKDRDARESQ